MKKINRSPLYYLVDKYKNFYQISVFSKDINVFYDIFGGGGIILSNVEAKKYHYNDIDKNLTNLLKVFYKTPIKKMLLLLKK
ncbi:DNA adenine methylase [Mycoplasma sp. CSL7491-lung]|uniref:DNA adenine methylase n=1 Tax=Mycoplasma sp. CSL7491-lung TaxID=549718 RepID=UPI001C10B67B|nr:DNA adenine methylase [Mycoplasma sp. CSL7491-lung]MBU4692708.1 DNA adenine methylase [Mycoplasma sp. CSL7491-lung]